MQGIFKKYSCPWKSCSAFNLSMSAFATRKVIVLKAHLSCVFAVFAHNKHTRLHYMCSWCFKLIYLLDSCVYPFIYLVDIFCLRCRKERQLEYCSICKFKTTCFIWICSQRLSFGNVWREETSVHWPNRICYNAWLCKFFKF